ncbi:MAG: hypothetical protein M1816_001044 [Peltula sp. TS41687]|nr:MAG: hypothetical protein M1816_001044 [Peltula sp. TS41687]
MKSEPGNISGHPKSSSSSSSLFEQIESYAWSRDAEFQGGLTAILGTNASPERAAELTLRARCFFYSRRVDYNVSVDFDAYTSWRRDRSVVGSIVEDQTPTPTPSNGGIFEKTTAEKQISAPPPPSDRQTRSSISAAPGLMSSSSAEPVPYPASFARVVELITTGEAIPGIKDISDTVLDGQESRSIIVRRRKPWEKEDDQPCTDRLGEVVGARTEVTAKTT